MGIKLRLNSSTRQEDKKSKEDKKNKVRGKRVVSSEEVSRDKRRKAKDRKFEPPKPLATPSFTRDHSFDRRTVGEEKPYDFLHNCTTCLRWPVCGDSKKSGYYMCSRYQENTIDVSVDELEMFKAGGEEDSSAPEESEADNSFLVSASGEGEESIMNMLERVLDTNMPVPPDLRVNDSDFPKAPNFYEWATNKKFTQDGVKPFPRQIEIGFKLLGEYCPKCSDMKWFDTKVRVDTPIGVIRERVQPLAFGVCPKCKSKKSEMLGSNLMDEYYTLVGLAGQRAAKTASTVLWEGYNLHRLVTLSNPALAFGLLPTQPLIGTFAALTFNQAVENAWIPFRNVLTTSRWYTEYHDFLRSRGRELGEELFTLGENSVRYRHRNLIYSPSGPSKRVMRGRTRVCIPAGHFVATTEGPVDISDPNLVGMTAVVNGYKTKITHHHDNGVVETYSMKLSNGQTIRCTGDHVFPVWDAKNLKLTQRRALDIVGTDRIIEDLTPTFDSHSKIETPVPSLESHNFTKRRLPEKVIERMCSRKSFTYQDFEDLTPNKNQFYVYTSKLGRMGVLLKKSQKTYSQPGVPNPGRFSIAKKFRDFDTLWALYREGMSKPKRELRDMDFPATLPSSSFYLIGAMLSEGKYYYDHEFELVDSNKDFIDKCSDSWEDLTGMKPRLNGPYKVTGRKTKVYALRWASSFEKEFLRNLGLEPAWAETKTVPDFVSQAAKKDILQLLAGFIDGDGTIKSTSLSFNSTSKQMLKSIHQLLNMVGVSAKIKYRHLKTPVKKRVRRRSTKLYKSAKGYGGVKVSNRLDYLTLFNLLRPYSVKLGRLDNWVAATGVEGTNVCGLKTAVVPGTHTKLWNGSRTRRYLTVSEDLNDQYNLTRFLAHPLIRNTDVPALIGKPYRFHSVVSLKPTGREERVYKITVAHKEHIFGIDGVLSSNCAMIDEAGWFPMSSATGKEMERLDVKGVDVALGRSLFTVKTAHRRRTQEGFDGLFKPMKYLVSSPSGIQDYIMTSYRRAMGSSEIFRFKYASWEFNPLLKREDFAEEFRDKPIDAARDYECNPPAGEGLFITDTDSIEKCVSHANAFQTDTSVGLSKTKSRITKGNVSLVRKPNTPHATILAIDVGLVNNSFSFSIVTLPNECTLPPIDEYGERDYDEIDEEDDDTLMVPVKILGTGEVMPEPGTTISLTHLYKHCLIPLCEIFDVRYVVSDRWQNATISSNLEERFEIEPHEIRCRWEDFVLTRELIQQGMMELPRGEKSIKELIEQPHDNYPNMYKRKTSDHLLWQLASVREQTNVTVTKPDYGTDDAFRTVVIGASLIQNLEIAHSLYNGGGTVEEVKKSGPLAISLGYGSKQIKSGKNSLPSAGGSAGGNSSLVHSVKLTWNR